MEKIPKSKCEEMLDKEAERVATSILHGLATNSRAKQKKPFGFFV
jgi:hypothetical protein